MAKSYTNRATGLTVVSGRIKEISEDRKTVTVGVQTWDKEAGVNVDSDIMLKTPVPVEGLKENHIVTATGFKGAGGVINADTVSSGNSCVVAEGFDVISGSVMFATRRDEVKEDGTPNLTKAGTPRKPHFDITINTGTGADRVQHTVKIYNSANEPDKDLIGRYEKLFKNFDRKENPIYATIVTKDENASSYVRPYTDRDGNERQQECVSHMGANFMDFEFMKGRAREQSKNAQEQPAQEVPAQEAPAQEVSGNGFAYNPDEMDDMDDYGLDE